MDAQSWGLLLAGAVGGVCLTLVSGAVRDAVLGAVDVLVGWWWDLIDACRMVLLVVGLLLLVGLAGWAVVVLLLPRLVQ